MELVELIALWNSFDWAAIRALNVDVWFGMLFVPLRICLFLTVCILGVVDESKMKHDAELAQCVWLLCFCY